MQVRPAADEDAAGMGRVLAEIAARQASSRPTDPAHVLRHYIRHPDRLACSVAVDAAGAICGFQSLKRASEGNPYGLAAGWGIIGTHISPSAARRGVGSALFRASLAAARAARLSFVDATIGATNGPALAYYDAMGFRTYRTTETSVCKCLTLD